MASRGSKATNGHVTTTEYSILFTTPLGVKILKGNGNMHSLPDYAHTPNSIYAKLYPNGVLHEMRFYDSNGFPIVEIAYHPEPKINDGKRDAIVHYHLYDELKRGDANKMTNEMKEKYSEYLKEFDLYDKC